MTKIKAFAPSIDQQYAAPDTCSYVSYYCAYCTEPFLLVDPDNGYQAGGAVQTVQYRNKETNEVIEENRARGICMKCIHDMMRGQQE
jgi:hypothetical protein